jgi:chromatin segregation and condensation protein Rec8/ScpA/Scc1 (kleisin family)
MVQSVGSVRFSQVVESYRTRTEVATAFLAVLVLVRRGEVDAAQGDLFTDIALGPGTAPESLAASPGNEFIN